MTPDDRQSEENKRGEVLFRRKLAAQQSTGDQVYFEDVHSREAILSLMGERIAQTRADMEAIAGRGIGLSPFLELGAERCQRALLMVNELGASGFAVDISLDMLRYASIVAEHFNYSRLPVRVACDINNLPFRPGVITLAFCYQTLHHFPDPRPIIQGIRRVQTDDGVFFFDDEPVVGQVTHLARVSHRRGQRLNFRERLLSKAGLLSLISKADGLEIEHNILESEFDLRTWRQALSVYRALSITVNRKLRVRMASLAPSPASLVASLVGGNIRAVCGSVETGASRPPAGNLLELLACPNCADKPRLIPLPDEGLSCAACGNIYPIIDGVYLVFEKSLGRSLYPEYYPHPTPAHQ